MGGHGGSLPDNDDSDDDEKGDPDIHDAKKVKKTPQKSSKTIRKRSETVQIK